MKTKTVFVIYMLFASLAVLFSQDIDAEIKAAYYFISPSEGSRVEGPAVLRVFPAQIARGWVPYILARIIHAAGRDEMILGNDSLVLPGNPNEIIQVRAEAFLEDPSGRRISLGKAGFSMSPSVVHISPYPLNNERPDGSGERPYPFSYLDDALVYIKELGKRAIHIHGDIRVRSQLVVAENTAILGSQGGPAEKSRLIFDPGASVAVRGGRLSLSSINITTDAAGPASGSVPSGVTSNITASSAADRIDFSITNYVTSGIQGETAGPLVRVERGGSFFLTDVALNHDGALLELADDTEFSFIGGSLYGNGSGFTRIPIIRSARARIRLDGVNFVLKGERTLALEMRAGSLKMTGCDLAVSGLRTASALSLNGVEADLNNCDFSAEAGDYASVIESERSRLSFSWGNLSAKARDCVLVVMDNTAAIFAGSGFEFSSSFLARAIEVKDLFPVVSDCVFSFTGSSRESEIFSTANSARIPAAAAGHPSRGLIARNSFGGFKYIMGKEFAAGNIADFNRAFAPAGNENSLAERL